MSLTVSYIAFMLLGVILGVLMGSLGIERERQKRRAADHRNLHLLRTLIEFRDENDRLTQIVDPADFWKK